jgi:hypothetical protein
MGPPVPAAFRHFVEHVRGLTGSLYGRRMYEVMRYWDEDLADWDADEREFATSVRKATADRTAPRSRMTPGGRVEKQHIPATQAPAKI